MFAYSPASHDGAGYAIITDRFVCLLGAQATAEVARSVFWLLDGDDAQLHDALGTLVHVESVECFAVVEILDLDARSMNIVMCGDVSVRVHGTTASRALPGSRSWISTEARGVNALRMTLEEGSTHGELLPLRRGIVRTNAVVAEPVSDYPFTSAEDVTVLPVPGTPAIEDHAPRWVLQLPDGHELEAEGTIVIGRGPGDDEGSVRHVAAPSPERQISASHLELALVGGELVARDLDSTNGTIVLTPERAPRLLHRGDTTSLRPGDILDLGESFRVVVGNRD